MLRQMFVDGKYIILDEFDNIVFSVKLEDNQIVIETKNEVYAGPIEFLALSTFPESYILNVK